MEAAELYEKAAKGKFQAEAYEALVPIYTELNAHESALRSLDSLDSIIGLTNEQLFMKAEAHMALEQYDLAKELVHPLQPWFLESGFTGPLQVTGIKKNGKWHAIEYNIRLGVTTTALLLRMLEDPLENLIDVVENRKTDCTIAPYKNSPSRNIDRYKSSDHWSNMNPDACWERFPRQSLGPPRFFESNLSALLPWAGASLRPSFHASRR